VGKKSNTRQTESKFYLQHAVFHALSIIDKKEKNKNLTSYLTYQYICVPVSSTNRRELKVYFVKALFKVLIIVIARTMMGIKETPFN